MRAKVNQHPAFSSRKKERENDMYSTLFVLITAICDGKNRIDE